MAKIKNQRQFERLKEKLQAGEFKENPELELELAQAAQEWKASQLPKSQDALSSTLQKVADRPYLGAPTALLENAVSMVTGLAGSAVGGAASLPVLLASGNDAANQRLQQIQQAMTYQPRTEMGQEFQESVGEFGETLNTGVMDAINNPAPYGLGITNPGAATAAQTGIEAALMTVGAKRPRAPRTNKQVLGDQLRAKGITIPPGSTRTGPAIVESLSGRAKVRQMAAERNMPAIKKMVNEDLGRPPGATISIEALEKYRIDRASAYRVLDEAGDIGLDTNFRRGIRNATNDIQSAADTFSDLAKSTGAVDELLRISNGMVEQSVARSLNAKTARGVLGILRDKADEAFRGGHGEVGRAYRGMAKEFESAIERELQRKGLTTALEDFRAARRDMAKSYSAQNALVGGTDIIDPASFRSQIDAGVPLDGNMRLLGEGNAKFPQSLSVSPTVREGPQASSAVDFLTVMGGGGAAIADPNFIPLALAPLARIGARNAMLSQAGQRLGSPSFATRPPAGLLGVGATQEPRNRVTEKDSIFNK